MVDQKAIYTFTKRGVFYFSRRVPRSLRHRFDQSRIVACLHTRSLPQARKSALALSSQLEMVWAQMHLEGVVGPIRVPVGAVALARPADPRPSIRLSEAGDLYRRLKGCGKGKGFKAYTDRNLGYVVDCLGDASISDLKTTDAGRFRDFLIARKLSTISIKRVLSTVRAAVDVILVPLGILLVVKMIPLHLMKAFRVAADQRAERPVSRTAVVLIVAIWCIVPGALLWAFWPDPAK